MQIPINKNDIIVQAESENEKEINIDEDDNSSVVEESIEENYEKTVEEKFNTINPDTHKDDSVLKKDEPENETVISNNTSFHNEVTTKKVKRTDLSTTSTDVFPPTHIAGNIYGFRYRDDTFVDHWFKPNDIVEIRLRQREDQSGNFRQYLRLFGNGQDLRTYHAFDNDADFFSTLPSYTSSHIYVQSALRTENALYGNVTWKVIPRTDAHFYEVFYQYVDKEMNTTFYQSTGKFVKIDGSAPTIILTETHEQHTQPTTIDISITDDGSGVNHYRYRLEKDGVWGSWSDWVESDHGEVELKQTGQYRIQVESEDRVGNNSELTSNIYKIDNTNPTNPIIETNTAWTNSNVSVNITSGTDAHSGVARTEYRFNKGSWLTYNGTFTVSTDGETTIEARTIDNAGNVSGTVSKTVKVDKEIPTLTIDWSTTKPTHDDVVLTAKGSDKYSGVKRIKLPDNTWVNSSTATYNAKQNGTFTFVVEDYAGNTYSKSIEVKNIDKTISIHSPIIEPFNDVEIQAEAYVVGTNIFPVTIEDWRDNHNDWRLVVSSSPLRMVEETYELPNGTIQLKPLSKTIRLEGKGEMPTKTLLKKQAIDNKSIILVEGNNSRGKYELIFPENALELLIDPTTAKRGKYEFTVTWDLISAP